MADTIKSIKTQEGSDARIIELVKIMEGFETDEIAAATIATARRRNVTDDLIVGINAAAAMQQEDYKAYMLKIAQMTCMFVEKLQDEQDTSSQ